VEKNELKNASLLLALNFLFFVFPNFSAHAAKEQITSPRLIRWKVNHGPYDLVRKTAEKLEASISRRSEGQLKLEVIAPKEDFSTGFKDVKDVMSSVANGEVEMSQIYADALTLYDDQLTLFGSPFLFKNYAHAERFFHTKEAESLLGHMVSASGNKLRGLAFTYSGGYRIIATKNRELHRIEDFTGLKLYPDPSGYNSLTSSIYEALGIKMEGDQPLETLPELVTNGNVDGFESTYLAYGLLDEKKFAPVVNETKHSLLVTIIVVNEAFFQSLDSAQKKILRQAIEIVAKEERRIAIERSKEISANFEKSGGRVIRMTDAQSLRLQRVLEPVRKNFKYPTLMRAVERVKNK